jgi:hypothetical protein
MKMYYIVGAAVILLVIMIIFRRLFAAPKDNYDFDSLSHGAALPPATSENSDFMDRIGKSLGVDNFHELIDKAEGLMKEGKKEEAMEYMKANAHVDNQRAQKIFALFEARFKQNS